MDSKTSFATYETYPYAAIAASCGLPNLAWVAHDEASLAIEISAKSTSRWSDRGVYVQHLFDAYARAQAQLYLGEPALAAECFVDFDRRAKGKLILIPHMMKVFRAELEVRIALALRWQNKEAKPVHKLLRNLRRLNTTWGNALALLLEAGELHLAGNRSAASRLAREQAVPALQSVGMLAHRDAALAYAARLDGRQPAEADAGLGARGVVRPMLFLALLVPGYAMLTGDARS